ncbi:hypothetical protein F4861DRAFT_513012 [Xylaria intraflava]|nr:hypothetical protein F4861DRAFT_513012 [Xylaria intraflava]
MAGIRRGPKSNPEKGTTEPQRRELQPGQGSQPTAVLLARSARFVLGLWPRDVIYRVISTRVWHDGTHVRPWRLFTRWNVVIVCLSTGQWMGTALTVRPSLACNMHRSGSVHPIRTGVTYCRIGGGASGKVDMGLGDVVVRTGVIHEDIT